MADILQITLPDGTTYNLKDSTAVTNVGWDSTNQKIQKTINGTTSDVVTLPLIVGTGANSAQGAGGTASGDYSFAFGSGSEASGNGGVAFMRGIASGQGSFAIGVQNGSQRQPEASGAGSIAIGASVYSTGIYSIAIGMMANATANMAIAIGSRTIAGSANQLAVGKYNIEDTNSTYAFIIGNGSKDARSNAMTVDWNGNGVLAGKLTVGANPTNNMDVVTKSYCDAHGLPSVTSSDNGKFLRVVDGAWAAASLPIYNGALRGA